MQYTMTTRQAEATSKMVAQWQEQHNKLISEAHRLGWDKFMSIYKTGPSKPAHLIRF